jgi:hypothetical protein
MEVYIPETIADVSNNATEKGNVIIFLFSHFSY